MWIIHRPSPIDTEHMAGGSFNIRIYSAPYGNLAANW